ncbi:hypothetical protein FRC08_000536 [Ceratobasidium sp. 394]|nr:hypothetical protein FRC08_000536 [Ceratobasidium sp. 394]
MPARSQKSKEEIEKLLQLAVEDVEERGPSYRDAADLRGVPPKTLWGRVHGRQERHKAHEAEQALTDDEE